MYKTNMLGPMTKEKIKTSHQGGSADLRDEEDDLL